MIRSLALALTASLALMACQKEPDSIGLKTATILVNPVPDRPAVGYFDLQNGPTDLVLEYARVPLAQRTEMHQTVETGGRTSMRQVDRVPISAGQPLSFKPGGLHLMIYKLDPAALREGRAELQLRFSDGSQINYNAYVRVMGQQGS